MSSTTLHQNITNYTDSVSRPSFLTGFYNWCRGQQENRLFWLGIALMGHGCIITPLTIMAVLMGGNMLSLFILAIVSMGMTLVTNLAALPTKITIPVFFLSILIDLGIVIASAFMGYSTGIFS